VKYENGRQFLKRYGESIVITEAVTQRDGAIAGTDVKQYRAIIEGVQPEIDSGRFAIKRVIGEQVVVEADIFADGHDAVVAVLLYRKSTESHWHEAPMEFLVNDRWRGAFTVTEMGQYVYTLRAWVDHFKTWHRDLQKRLAAGQDVSVDLWIGADLVDAASKRARGDDARQLQSISARLHGEETQFDRAQLALDDNLYRLMMRYPDLRYAHTYEKQLRVTVERTRARFSAWYELFPRSCSPAPGRHGTFRDCAERLPYVAAMGFDIVYLPPIHPIGRAFRKGKNNAVVAQPGDIGSPWAIGAAEGGHKAIHPELGTLEDFHYLVRRARELGMEIALDIAFQCSPDHPYVTEHPEWFVKRPDGTIQYAENPPKKYQDIYPINFETAKAQELWEELRSVMLYWIAQGVHVFRVDNPHTKSFYFWEWAINSIKQQHPETIFLSEAFTRPKVMYNLAKLGFTQSYTYFTWRNSKWELTQYMTELTQTEVREFFRPNFWPNTPDILHAFLQNGGRTAFKIRLVLAATMTANYGLYGPAFELCVNVPREPGSEEYLDSEKYQLRHWNLDHPDSLRDLMTRVNWIRRDNPALQSDWSIRFHPTDNEQIICYSKRTPDYSNRILVVASFDPVHTQAGWVGVDLNELGIDPNRPYMVHDLLSGATYTWQTWSWNYVELRPHDIAAHVFRIEQP
jgi:starch synthase (maltosyl-transferring)